MASSEDSTIEANSANRASLSLGGGAAPEMFFKAYPSHLDAKEERAINLARVLCK